MEHTDKLMLEPLTLLFSAQNGLLQITPWLIRKLFPDDFVENIKSFSISTPYPHLSIITDPQSIHLVVDTLPGPALSISTQVIKNFMGPGDAYSKNSSSQRSSLQVPAKNRNHREITQGRERGTCKCSEAGGKSMPAAEGHRCCFIQQTKDCRAIEAKEEALLRFPPYNPTENIVS